MELVVQEGDWVTECPGRLLVYLKGMLAGLSAVRAVLEASMRAFGKVSCCMDANGQQLRIVGNLSVIVLEHFRGCAEIAIAA